ncbi:MAG: Zn-dependent hydrolase [Hyphomicrobiaceae bacterium]|nr:Zn-dependent hydrolase [Hyphomicrobiaceae bacterium]
MRNLKASVARVAEDIDALALITEPGRPWTRRAFTPLFASGRAWLDERFRQAGLATHVDASGNLIGRRAGGAGTRGVIMLGSHSDTVPDGGRYDGVAGVVAALEVARILAERGITLAHDLEIVDFLAEEVSLYGVSCLGSRGMAGVRPPEWLGRARDGVSLAAAIDAVGGTTSSAAATPRDDIRAFFELHIEQGPILEAEGRDIGVVTAIAGITRFEIKVTGRADHAGTTPMGRRRDALVAAAELVGWVDRTARAMAPAAQHFTATVGELEIEPNAANVVPSLARLLIDARAVDAADMDRFRALVAQEAAACAERHGVATQVATISDNPARPMDAQLIDRLETCCGKVGARSRRLISGAGHDATWIARIAPAAMVFIPCVGGRSHTPEEEASAADVALGAEVMLEAVLETDALA